MSRLGARRGWTIGIFGYVALLGAALQLRGALLPNFQSSFGVSEGLLGFVSTAASIGFLLSIVAVGMLVSRIDVKRFLLLGLGGVGASFWLVAASGTFGSLLVFLFATGVTSGVLHGLDRPVLSHLYPERRGRVFNVDDMMWAVGATVGPLFATAVLFVAGWRTVYLLLGFAFVPLLVLAWRLDLPPGIEDEQSLSLREIGDLLSSPAMVGMSLAMLFLSFVESGIFTWLPYYVGQSLPRPVANAALSGYLAAYVPGRYVFSRITLRFDNVDLVLGSTMLAVVFLYLAFVVLSGYAMLAAIVVVGFLVAGSFPTLLAWGTNVTPEYSGPVGAVALGTSSVGFFVFPATMGLVAERYHIDVAMQSLVVVAALLALLVAGIRVLRGASTDGTGVL